MIEWCVRILLLAAVVVAVPAALLALRVLWQAHCSLGEQRRRYEKMRAEHEEMKARVEQRIHGHIHCASDRADAVDDALRSGFSGRRSR